MPKPTDRPSPDEAPKLRIEYVPIASIKLDPENAREHSKSQIKQLAMSVRETAFNMPIAVDRALSVQMYRRLIWVW